MIDERPTHLDLFSGIGGFALAAKWAGFRTVAFCEIEPYCQRVLAKNFGAVADAHECGASKDRGNAGEMRGLQEAQRGSKQRPDLFGRSGVAPRIASDIFTFDGTRYRGASLLTGGFPCQPFSVAGKRRGAADDRHLWPEMLRVIGEARPAWVLGENVPGIIPMELDNVLSQLEAIGYATRAFIIPACAVDARHRRDRLWIVGRDVADADDGSGSRFGQHGWEVLSKQESVRLGGSGSLSSDSNGSALQEWQRKDASRSRANSRTVAERGIQWLPEPDVCGMVDGLPEELDGGFLNADQRMDSKGNAPAGTQNVLRDLWERIAARTASQGRRSFQQLVGQLADALCALSHETSLGNRQEALATALGYLHRLRQGCETLGLMRDPSDSFAQVWQSLSRPQADWAHLASYLGPFHSEWPDTQRVAHKIPARVDRLRGLGNSIVPQVACEILKGIRQMI